LYGEEKAKRDIQELGMKDVD